jgi:hypothetical protein
MQLNIDPANTPFYKDLFGVLGWQTLYETDGVLGVKDEHGISLWFLAKTNDTPNDYDGPGMNHLGINTATQADVDAVAAHLAEQDVTHLFETPRHRPDFSASEQETYYQVMFESPDRILFEVVYTGAKDA